MPNPEQLDFVPRWLGIDFPETRSIGSWQEMHTATLSSNFQQSLPKAVREAINPTPPPTASRKYNPATGTFRPRLAMKSTTRSLLATTLLAICVLPALASLPMKCWEDGKGDFTCSDVVPPEASDHARREYGEDGIPRLELPRAPTEEELAQQKQMDELSAQAARIRAEQEAYDKRLLDFYPTIEDLVRKRESTIADMDLRIESARDQVRQQQTRLASLQARAAEAERRGQQPEPSLLEAIATTALALSDLQSDVELRQAEKGDKLAELDAQLKRYRQLRPQGAAEAEADKAGPPAADKPILTAVHCATEAECGRLWEEAMAYVRTHATMPVDLAADRILATAPPRDVGDIAITLTRQADREGNGERIFMDLQCADLPEARTFCLGPQVVAIRKQFREALGPRVPE